MAYVDSNLDNPEKWFQVKLYTGTGVDDLAITLDGDENMQPDLVIIKERNDTGHHLVYDAVRGATKEVYTNLNNAESTNAATLKSFDSDGFTLGTGGGVNTDDNTHVAWCWKAGGGSGSSNEDGTINTTSTSVSTTAGFSISKYTGNATNGATVGHGLGAAPDFIFGKDLSDTSGWCVWHKDLTDAGYKLSLNGTDAQSDDVYAFGGSSRTAPTSTVFSLGSGGGLNGSNANVVYCFAPKKAFSKFGKWTGNGNADGAFIYTGFRPAWVMIKRTNSTQNWYIWDSKRLGYNVDNNHLQAQGTDAEGTADTLDLLSNGFKIRESGVGTNGSGDTYVYMAFAEQPFVNSKGVPCNAR